MAGWIPDVVTLTTIQSVWGNTIRNQVVQVFASTAERDAHGADGMIGTTPDHVVWLYVGGTGWVEISGPAHNYTPVVQQGGSPAVGSLYRGEWWRRYDRIDVAVTWINGASAVTPPGTVAVSLPVQGLNFQQAEPLGVGYILNASAPGATAYAGGLAVALNNGFAYFVQPPSSAALGNAGSAFGELLSPGDVIYLNVTYRAASLTALVLEADDAG